MPRARKTAPIEYADAAKTPRHTPDGESWLDPDGNAPQLDESGRLIAPFRYQTLYHGVEVWAIGTKCPVAPAPYARFVAEQEAKHAKKPGAK